MQINAGWQLNSNILWPAKQLQLELLLLVPGRSSRCLEPGEASPSSGCCVDYVIRWRAARVWRASMIMIHPLSLSLYLSLSLSFSFSLFLSRVEWMSNDNKWVIRLSVNDYHIIINSRSMRFNHFKHIITS